MKNILQHQQFVESLTELSESIRIPSSVLLLKNIFDNMLSQQKNVHSVKLDIVFEPCRGVVSV